MIKNDLIPILDEAFEAFGFQYGCLGDPELGVVWEKGNFDTLDGSDLPHSLFGDLEAISGTLEYLETNKLPRIMSQGDTRSVMGVLECEDKKYPYSFFLNTVQSVVEHHGFAKKVDSWLIDRGKMLPSG